LQVGDTGPVESARRSNSRVLGSPFSGLSGQFLCRSLEFCAAENGFFGAYPVLNCKLDFFMHRFRI
jgi:hypothetical protein